MPICRIEGQSVKKHKFEGGKKTRTPSGGPPGSESRIGQGKEFENFELVGLVGFI